MDQFEIEIDDMAINLLAKAPLASDLRLITVAMKISQNLERDRRRGHHHRPARARIESGAAAQDLMWTSRAWPAIALGLLKEALDAFVNKEPEKARAIVPRDKEVDALNRQLIPRICPATWWKIRPPSAAA